MTARAVSLTIVAFFLGAFAAGGIGVRVIREVKTTEDATSLPQENIAPEADPGYFVDPDETLIASTALVPRSIAVGDGQVTISYDLASLAPQQRFLPAELDAAVANATEPVYPRIWVIETAGGPLEGGPENADATTARFDVDAEFSVDDIESVRVTEAVAPFPIDIGFTLSESEPVAEIGFGVTVELLDVVEQGSVTVVRVAFEPGDTELGNLSIVGEGPGWRSSEVSGDGERVTALTWVDGPLPDEIPLRTTGGVWLPIDGEFDVSYGGAP